MLSKNIQKFILEKTNSSQVISVECIQNLWSGYGKILKVHLDSKERKSIIVKLVSIPEKTNHPRGWDSEVSNLRKIKSYQVENCFYLKFGVKLKGNNLPYVPKLIGSTSKNQNTVLILEDLNILGFTEKRESLNLCETKLCLTWLAHFHAVFLEQDLNGLWEVGTYWHLDTRPDEFEAMPESDLKTYAKSIDKKLKNCGYKTLLHGDAKLDNFCFKQDGTGVAAVDFQYAGLGCGMKDVIYFLGSFLTENELLKKETELLAFYFSELQKFTHVHQPKIDFNLLQKEWSQMYPLAWADFYRFLKGWRPGHWKLNDYGDQMVSKAIRSIKK